MLGCGTPGAAPSPPQRLLLVGGFDDGDVFCLLSDGVQRQRQQAPWFVLRRRRAVLQRGLGHAHPRADAASPAKHNLVARSTAACTVAQASALSIAITCISKMVNASSRVTFMSKQGAGLLIRCVPSKPGASWS